LPDKVKDKSEYELVVVLKNDGEEFAKTVDTKIAKLITDNGGEIISSELLGTKSLAYKIKGETFGVYECIRAMLPADASNKIAGVLNITDGVLRYLLTKVDAKAETYLAEEAKRRKDHREEMERDEKASESNDGSDNKEA